MLWCTSHCSCGDELWPYPHPQPEPAPNTDTEKQHEGTLSILQQHPRGASQSPSSSSTGSEDSLELCSPTITPPAIPLPALPLYPQVWQLDNQTLAVFLKQLVHTQKESFSQHLSLQTKLQRQTSSFLICFFFFCFFLSKNLEMGAEEEKNIILVFFSGRRWN